MSFVCGTIQVCVYVDVFVLCVYGRDHAWGLAAVNW